MKQNLSHFSNIAGFRSIAWLAIFAIAGVTFPTGIALPLINGSFEAPDVPSGSINVELTPAGWTSTGSYTPHLFDSPPSSAGPWPDAQDGNQYISISAVDFPGPHTHTELRQDFTVSVTGTHVLSWHENAVLNVAGTPYVVEITGAPSPISWSFGAPLGTVPWRFHSESISLLPGNYSLIFRASSTGIGRTLLDNVTLESPVANHPPVAVARVSPDADLDDGAAEVILISVNHLDAPARFDGSLSTDPDGHSLTESWLDNATPSGSETRLTLDDHTIRLTVDDGHGGVSTATVNVTVITAEEAVGYLLAMIERSSIRPDWRRSLSNLLRLDAGLFAGTIDLPRTSPCEAGVAGLRAFKDLIRRLSSPPVFLMPRDLAVELNYLADQIISNVRCE